jgi:hypothetical protein
MTPLHPLQTLTGILVMVLCVYAIWVGSGPARDERRARKAKR